MDNKKVLLRILKYTKPYAFHLTGAIFCALGNVLLSLYIPIIIGDAVDCIVEKGSVNFEMITHYSVVLAVTVIASGIFGWLLNLCTNKLTYGTVRSMRLAAFEKLNTVPVSYIDSHSHGDLMTRVVGDIDTVSDGLLQGFTQLFSGIVTIIGTLVFMFMINVGIGALVVVVTPVSLVVASVISRACHKMFGRQAEVRGRLNGIVEEMIGNQKTVKAMMYEDTAFDRFENVNTELYDCGFKAQFFSALVNPSTRFVNGLVYALVGITGALTAIGGGISVGQLSCFLSYANQYTKPFNEISGVIAQFQSALTSAARVFELIDAESESEEEETEKLGDVDGDISIDNVSFSYDPSRKLIEKLNVDVRHGQKIAIVGPTGCGKTTMINLLMRFYDVCGGKIILEGKDIRSIPRRELRRNYGMVLQDTWLFSGTIRDNIAYGRPDSSDEEIRLAARKSYASHFIEKLPDGYDTIISEVGENISQGQKQLLCIARVMLMQPPILILDEATSSIDTLTEIRIQKVFSEMMTGKTAFIVAHRLSTIKEADVILVMNNGSVVEQGSHAELLARKGFYYDLYNSQFDR